MRIASLFAILLLGAGAWADDPPETAPAELAEARAQLEKAEETLGKAVARVAALEMPPTELTEAKARLDTAEEAFREALLQVVALGGGVDGRTRESHFKMHDLFPDRDNAMLGVVIHDHDDGVHVAAVTPDSGAEAAGILADDVIVAINGKVLSTEAHPGQSLREAMEEVEAGEKVAIAFVRDGEEHDVEVIATTHRHPGRSMRWRMAGPIDINPKAVHFFGGPGRHMQRRIHHAEPELELVDIGEDLGKYFGVDSGVLVLDTPPGSNLKPGDILRRIDDADIRNADEAYHLLADLNGASTATIRRENRSRNVKVEPLEGMDRHFDIIMRGVENAGNEVEEEIEVELESTEEE